MNDREVTSAISCITVDCAGYIEKCLHNGEPTDFMDHFCQYKQEKDILLSIALFLV